MIVPVVMCQEGLLSGLQYSATCEGSLVDESQTHYYQASVRLRKPRKTGY